ncbi:CLUMA_CG004831, isoform A [Clunio marinus]|uniref:CLUMA_CG004831, isoform A n=1 Tax=Clunio marinus TaxID=568069 RepID=A0A1J1HYD4_9DIPT|nr:CLUMA_CG004831, isoform A [Clunio marinus]
MDFIFDCFFEEVLKKIERSGLKTRQNRQNVIDQLDSLIVGCSKGQNVPQDEVSGVAVMSAIKYHQTIKASNSEVCRMGKFHNILYIAVKIAWNWDIKDSSIVCALLNEIYECEKTFERLFLGAIFGSNAPYLIAGWRSDFKDQDENTRALVFFLHHATIMQLQFTVNDRKIPFIDIPIESCGKASPLRVALQATAPDILMIFLRFGANPNPLDGGIPPVLAVMDKLIEFQEMERYPYQLVSCLKLLLSVIPSLELPYKPLVFELRKTMFLDKYLILLKSKLIQPNMVFGVCNLKQLSRCAIRKDLMNNFQLPDGIKLLNIPKSLKRYIDLLDG